jgi:tape measure domain-containing protein
MVSKAEKEFLIRVKADIQDAVRKLETLQKEVVETGRAGQTSAAGIAKIAGAISALTRISQSYISLQIAKKLIETADRFNILQDRIKTATKHFGDYNTVSRELFRISQKNGTALESNVELFQRLARAAPELKATQEQVLAVTDAIGQLSVISGATPEAQKFGLLQLSQGLSSGVLHAEELNSVLENIPEVANRIAHGLGLSVGQMRQLVLEGKLTSKQVFDSLLGQTEEINNQFQDIPDRLARSTTRLGNAFAKFLSDLDKSVGLTSALAKGMDAVSDALAPVELSASEIGKKLDELQAKLDAAPKARGSGALFVQIRELREQLQAALASSSDVNEVNQALAEIDKRIEAVQDRINSTPENLRQRTAGAGPQGRGERLSEFGLLIGDLERLEAQRTELTARIEKLKLGQPSSGGQVTQLTQEQIQAQEQINKTIAALQLEAATFGLTKTQAVLYKLGLDGASESQLQLARTALQTIEANEKLQEQQKEGKRIFEETRTPIELFNAELQKLNELYQAGAFGAVGSAEALDTLGRATKKATDDFKTLEHQGDITFQLLEQAVRGWGDQFTNTLADMVLTGKGTFKDLANSIIRDLLRIQIQARITQPLLGLGTNFLNGLFSSPATSAGGSGTSVAGVAHSGGIAGSLSTRRGVSSPVFTGAPRYHTGGFAGLSPGEVPAILQHGEEVLTRDDPRHAANLGASAGSGVNITVEVQNQGTPQAAKSVNGRLQGNEFVVSVVTQDIVGDGNIAQAIKRTFNIPRSVR